MVLMLKQSTAVTVKMGPFLDSTDGVTAETALTIAQADIRLSKNGGNIAQTNNATGATHDELGYYDVPLDTTDTATLGTLRVAIHESGALPVWQDFMVVPANVWDSLFGADKLQVDLTQVNGSNTTATLDTIKAETASILTDTAEIGAAGAGLTAVPWNSAWDTEVQSEVTDALNAYDPPTNAEMEARTLASASYATATALGAVDTVVDAILVDTGTTLPASIDALPTAIENADALLNRDMSTGTDSGSATVRTPRQALRALRNKVSRSGSTLTVTKEDDSTASWAAELTTDADAEPITEVDPASS